MTRRGKTADMTTRMIQNLGADDSWPSQRPCGQPWITGHSEWRCPEIMICWMIFEHYLKGAAHIKSTCFQKGKCENMQVSPCMWNVKSVMARYEIKCVYGVTLLPVCAGTGFQLPIASGKDLRRGCTLCLRGKELGLSLNSCKGLMPMITLTLLCLKDKYMFSKRWTSFPHQWMTEMKHVNLIWASVSKHTKSQMRCVA